MARVFNLSNRVALSALVLALSACGGDEPSSSGPASTATEGPTATETATPPTATAPSPPPDAPTPTSTPTPSASGEDQPGGGGDEAGARVPVAVTVGSDGNISPKTVYVPAFFALEFQVRNRTGSPLRVTWDASEPKGTFDVGVGKVGTRRVGGLKRGTYFLSIDGAGTVAVAAGAEPGP